jgi:hypothetical protein
VLNMPKDLEADLFWVTAKQWALLSVAEVSAICR